MGSLASTGLPMLRMSSYLSTFVISSILNSFQSFREPESGGSHCLGRQIWMLLQYVPQGDQYLLGCCCRRLQGCIARLREETELIDSRRLDTEQRGQR